MNTYTGQVGEFEKLAVQIMEIKQSGCMGIAHEVSAVGMMTTGGYIRICMSTHHAWFDGMQLLQVIIER